MKCNADCGGCKGCGGGALELSAGELHILNQLAQLAFLPVARAAGEDKPVYLEDSVYTPEEYSLILQCLEKRGLIHIRYDRPLIGASMEKYGAYDLHGSMALTARGQTVVELMDLMGVDGE